ncbi:MAG: hypothetical protein H6780_01885 [Candidatus Nomurabacteria bacterium]|nr:MAG: hypothetical protein H6780_01885 [Candidatus Nomurabacteria bacterium]
MQGQINPKIVGATIIGFALIGGAYTLSSLNNPRTVSQPAAIGAVAPERVAIAVNDEDQNGIEDWRDDFVTTEPIVLNNSASSTYEQPTTLTGQMSIHFLEDVIRSKNYGPFGKSEEEVVQYTVNSLAEQTNIELYDTPDIDIMNDWDQQDVRNYANTLAAILIENSTPGTENELTLMNDVVVNGNREKIAELEAIAVAYEGYITDTLKVPVPSFLVKEHLDFLNTLTAIHADIAAMSIALDDPVVALLRLKRYQEDVRGLGLAMQNMYASLEPYAPLIKKDDPAALFVVFSPDFQS